ncbi:hypothetical protein P885DRAFT_41467 [Corynascus similis CBS 632.67]
MVRLHRRPPSIAARLYIFGPNSSQTLTLRHSIQHRAFHFTPPRHRRPPSIRFAKPKFASPTPPPKAELRSQPQSRSHKDSRPEPLISHVVPPHGSRPPSTLRERLGRFRSKINWRRKILITLALLAVFIPATKAIESTNSNSNTSDDDDDNGPACLNPTRFTPFTITARDQVSPTAFVLTVRPSDARLGRAVVTRARRHGLWAVEVKQPECMVAREYTPLPLLDPSFAARSASDGEGGMEGGEEGEEGEEGELKLYVRRMPGGEVSGYLARLRVGDEIELRGPKLGFDLRARLGVVSEPRGDGEEKRKRKVVFLAGGTGIAPALQAASAVLDDPRVEMEVIWANRRREDCLGCGESRDGQQQGAVVTLLEEFRRRYGERFRYSCTVDEEGSFITAGTVARVTGASGRAAGLGWKAWGLWSTGSATNTKAEAVSAIIDSSACTYHSANRLVSSDDSDPLAGASKRSCQCKDVDGNHVQGGKNLFMISGPDGFVAHLAGVKVWHDGKQRQGPVMGVFGDLARRKPSLGEEWLVLKM